MSGALTLLSSCTSIPNPALTGSGGTSTDTSGTTDDDSETTDSTSMTSSTDGTEETGECPLASLDCPCTPGGSCDPGLECIDGVCQPIPVCGNGQLEASEVCDDGNTDPADGCETDCTPTALVSVVAGLRHTCVLTEVGNVICWGQNDVGQLGYRHIQNVGDNESPTIYGSVPLQLPVTALAAGAHHTCALLNNGEVTCWGGNSSGQLGLANINNIGDDEYPDTVEPINFDDDIVQVTAGSAFTCIKTATNKIHCWGSNSSGELGLGSMTNIGDNEVITDENTLASVGSVTKLVAGGSHICASVSNGGLRCWGSGGLGALGYSNTNNIGDTELPQTVGPVFGNEVIEVFSAGSHFTLMIYTSNGNSTVYGWGYGTYGQLGNASTMTYGDGVGPSSANVQLQGVPVDLRSGNAHSCAIFEDGGLGCWGRNQAGQLGYGFLFDIGDDEEAYMAGKLYFPAAVSQVAAGADHTCALLENGDLYCWGSNQHGQIGLGEPGTIGDNEPATDVPPVNLFD